MEHRVSRKVYMGADQMICSLGTGSDEVFKRIRGYESGLRMVSDMSLYHNPFIAGLLADEVEMCAYDDVTRLEQLFVNVISDILEKSGLESDSERLKVIFSSTKGNVGLLASNSGLQQPAFLSAMAGRISRRFGFANGVEVISNACISGVSALIIGQRLILDNRFDHAIIVGGDELTRFVVSGFQSFHSLSAQPCRPFDADRDGLSLGEACAGVLLTCNSSLAVQPAIVVKGGAISNDANHISGPSRTGDGLALAINGAIDQSGLKPDEIDFINAHGTATPYNDEMESKAIHLAGLKDAPVNSLKPYIGHTLGASGVIETILSACQLRQQTIIATRGYQQCGVPMAIDVFPTHREQPVSNALKLASGFGGCNAAVVIGLDSDSSQKASVADERGFRIAGSVRLSNGDELFSEYIRNEYKSAGSPNMKFFKMDDLSKLGYMAAEKLITPELKEKYDPSRIAVIITNRSSSLDTDIRHQELIDQDPEGASPAVFVYTLPNIVAGEIAIRHKLQGETTFFIQDRPDGFALDYAASLLDSSIADMVVYGWCDYLDGKGEVELKILIK